MSLILGAYANAAAAADPPFAAPSGIQGAGLGLGDQKGRVWLETTFHTQERLTVVGATLGGGYRVIDSLELEVMLPLAYLSVDVLNFNENGPDRERDSALGIGNPYLGISRVHLDGTLRYKAGLGVTLPVGSDEDLAGAAIAATVPTYGFQDFQLWYPDTFTIAAPLRMELGDPVVLGVDATPAVVFFSNDRASSDSELILQVSPGVGVYATDTLLVGARLPIVWLVTADDGDKAQVALEPYARFDVGSGFVNARFTANLDEPYGFAFDEGKFWGAHLGGGLVF